MVLKVYTAKVSYKGENRLNITVKSGDKDFAPTWEMVMGHKSGRLSDQGYIDKYVDLMRNSLKTNRRKWEELMSKEKVVLTCYCREGKFCHRILLARMLEKSGAIYMGEIDENSYHKK